MYVLCKKKLVKWLCSGEKIIEKEMLQPLYHGACRLKCLTILQLYLTTTITTSSKEVKEIDIKAMDYE